MDVLNKDVPIPEPCKIKNDIGQTFNQYSWLRPCVYTDKNTFFAGGLTVRNADIHINNGGDIYVDGLLLGTGGGSGTPLTDPLIINNVNCTNLMSPNVDTPLINGLPPVTTLTRVIPEPFIKNVIQANTNMTCGDLITPLINGSPVVNGLPNDLSIDTLTATTGITTDNLAVTNINGSPPILTTNWIIPEPIIRNNIQATNSMTCNNLVTSQINNYPYPNPQTLSANLSVNSVTASGSISTPSIVNLTDINGVAAYSPTIPVTFSEPIICNNINVAVNASIQDCDVVTNIDVGQNTTCVNMDVTTSSDLANLYVTTDYNSNTLTTTGQMDTTGKVEVFNDNDIDIITTGSHTYKINGIPFAPSALSRSIGIMYISTPIHLAFPTTSINKIPFQFDATNSKDFVSVTGGGMRYTGALDAYSAWRCKCIINYVPHDVFGFDPNSLWVFSINYNIAHPGSVLGQYETHIIDSAHDHVNLSWVLSNDTITVTKTLAPYFGACVYPGMIYTDFEIFNALCIIEPV